MTIKDSDLENWYDNNKLKYDQLCLSVKNILENVLSQEKIALVGIHHRTKQFNSLKNKCLKKKYDNTEMIMDISGIRIIALVEDDLKVISKIIENTFNIHKEDSIDKTNELGVDKFGYRSIHYICDLGSKRNDLEEYKDLRNLCFEIQIRTALSHAWAEIEHDRGYKLKGQLPNELKRRFNLLSGLLESADLEFNRLTREIKSYNATLKSSNEEQILDEEINKVSIINYLNKKILNSGFDLNPNDYSIEPLQDENNLFYKLLSFLNFHTINDIENIWKKNLSKITLETYKTSRFLHHILNRVLQYENFEKEISFYQADQDKDEILMVRKLEYEDLCKKLGKDFVEEILKKYNVMILKDYE
ncbi:hypothetical protein RFI36_11825 [Acinetobacter gerneri]|uniref:RelA/SpoT domain-containing protein n=1 Tax=Acinetobacter gerneri TaxID=202952 RepID=A0AAW8JHG2_9GAMM|nr:hypothetical protein [Acinetobacter gerneri]MDQ9010310.1 hypothetical protein [Acinetobacter gerneri]MDQ9014509.1 hypothetical protein [Acinetobacter gerneri]MDQ9025680.1 hypothetical protein [Acinetobacter gerneri]MDQ9052961.1 hypothetical protein [Acinetobacter gerneri]MDQ9060601.1 hypothetical protein [Acinetobacter gerneri]